MKDFIIIFALISGCVMQMLAAFGLLTLPGFLGRLHGASKASTLGLMCVLFAATLDQPGLEGTLKAVALLLFVFISSPLVAQAFASAYLRYNTEETENLKQANMEKQNEIS